MRTPVLIDLEPIVIMERLTRASLVFVLLAASDAVPAAQCSATSAEHRVPLLELYTSEGCNSCPPTDRWFSSLPGKGLTARKVVALAFHVDYWNDLGWSDPFSKPQYSDRQRAASLRNKARFVYTPQLLLDGRDYRRALFLDDIADVAISTYRPALHHPVCRCLRQHPTLRDARQRACAGDHCQVAGGCRLSHAWAHPSSASG